MRNDNESLPQRWIEFMDFIDDAAMDFASTFDKWVDIARLDHERDIETLLLLECYHRLSDAKRWGVSPFKDRGAGRLWRLYWAEQEQSRAVLQLLM